CGNPCYDRLVALWHRYNRVELHSSSIDDLSQGTGNWSRTHRDAVYPCGRFLNERSPLGYAELMLLIRHGDSQIMISYVLADDSVGAYHEVGLPALDSRQHGLFLFGFHLRPAQ